jgi:2-hydroxychromene-2-carboxylate isomerase
MAEGADIGSIEALIGVDPLLSAQIEAAPQDPQAADDLEAANRDALAGGCFGVPWICADGEVYFGQDRLYLLDRRLAQAA